MSKTIQIDSDPNDNWAEVELFRWQHGELPTNTDRRKMDVAAGLRGMADAIERGDPRDFPAPMNVISVLRYAAKKLDKQPSA